MMIDAPPAAVQAIAPLPSSATRFAPPLGRVIRYTVDETRSDGRAPRVARDADRSFVERTVTFARTESGYLATVTLLRTKAARGVPPVLERGLAALVGRPILVSLDAAGQVVAVEDRDALWAAVVEGTRAGLAEACRVPGRCAIPPKQSLAPLEAMPPAGRERMLAGSLSAIFATGLAPHPARAVTQASRASATPVTLTGSERVDRSADGALVLTRTVSGAVMTTPPGTMRIDSERVVDAQTALTRTYRETTTISAGSTTLTIVRTTVVS